MIECCDKVDQMFRDHSVAGNEIAHKHFEACNCLPSCTFTDFIGNNMIYVTKFDKTAIELTNRWNANVSGWEVPFKNCWILIWALNFFISIQRAKLVIFAEDYWVETENREELYTITDLLSLSGGLLGLFMGISLLSIIEIVYYSSLRWFWILRRRNFEQNWVGNS